MKLPITIELHTPVKHGEEEVKTLKITRPLVAGDLRGVKVAAMTFDDFMLIGGRLTGYPPSVIAQLSAPDFMALNTVVTDFLAPGQATGR